MFGRTKRAKESQREALEARDKAQRELTEQRKLWPEVRREGAWHRWRRDENHFARDLETLMKGGIG